jgi:SEC-C motif
MVYKELTPQPTVLQYYFGIDLLGIAKLYENFEARQARFYPEETWHPAPRAYMSPEQEQLAKGEQVELRPASDGFQLGRVFFEIFTGHNALGQMGKSALKSCASMFPRNFRALLLLKTFTTLLQQQPSDRGSWNMVIDVLAGAFTAYLELLIRTIKSLPRDIRLCLKYAFCDREDGRVKQTVQQMSTAFLCVWYWRWKTGAVERHMPERMLVGPILGLPHGSAPGCRKLVETMMVRGLIRRDGFDLRGEVTLTSFGKDIRDVLIGSPRLLHLKALGGQLRRRPAWRFAPSWWQYLPITDDPARDRIVPLDLCPCGSSRRYEKCCGNIAV